MPPSKSRKKKSGNRRKRKGGSKLQGGSGSSVEQERGAGGPEMDPKEEARLLALARAEAASLAELRRHWSKKMKHYARFVALGCGAKNDHVRARRSSYQRVPGAAEGGTPRSRKHSLVAAMNPSSYPLAFKLLTPKDDRQITSLVVKVDDTMGMRDVERLLAPHVQNYAEGEGGAEASAVGAATPETNTAGATATAVTTAVTTPAVTTPAVTGAGAAAADTIKFSFFYAPPGSLSRRRLETPTEWAWALKDFHKRRGSTAVATVENYSRHLLHDVVSADLDASSSKSLLGIHQIWEFATYTEAHMYITSQEIDRLCAYLQQSRRLAVRSAAAGALWAVAYNTSMRSLVHDNADVLRTLADPSFLSSFNAFADSDRDSTRTYVHVLGLMATLMADGGLGADDILGVGGTAFLGTYLKHAGASTPQGSRLAAQALYDSCLLSVKAQERIGRTCNPSTAVMAAAEHAAREAALDPENAAALVALGEVDKTLAPVNAVHAVVRGLTHIKDVKTFTCLLRICVLFSRSPSELLREALAVTTSAAGVSVVGTLLALLEELRGEAETAAAAAALGKGSGGASGGGGSPGSSGSSSGSNNFRHQRSSERGKHAEERRFALLSAEDRDSLILHVVSTLWGVLESAARSEHVLRRGAGSMSRGAMPGTGKSALDTCLALIEYARTLAHRRNRENRQKLVTKQTAYCAISAAACLVPMVLDEALQQDDAAAAPGLPMAAAAAAAAAAGAGAASSPAAATAGTTISMFQDLCALFDEARDFAHEPPPQKHARSMFETSIEAHGRGWASVRQRAASAMALLASGSMALTQQDLVQAGFFARLITQVEEEQAYEQDVRTRKGVDVRAAAAAGQARAERRVRSQQQQQQQQQSQQQFASAQMTDSAGAAAGAAAGVTDEPTACEWLLRAVAALAKVPKPQPLPASLVERCCALLQDPMWLALLEQKKKKQKRKAERDRRFSTTTGSKKKSKLKKKKSGSEGGGGGGGGGGGAYFAAPKKSKMTIREKAEAEAKAKADAVERKRLEAMEGPADMIGSVPMREIVATVRQVSDGLDSVLLMLWRLARQSKHHRMAMLLDATLVGLLRDAAAAALALGAMTVVESVLATLHMCIVDILDEENEAVPKGEFPPGVTKIQSLGVGAFEGWVEFLLRLSKECCGVGDGCYANVSKLLVRVRRGGGGGGAGAGAGAGFRQAFSKKATRPPLSEEGAASSSGRPEFGGRTNRVASRFGLPTVVAPDRLHTPKRGGVGAEEEETAAGPTTADPRCNVWTLATTVLWMLSLSKTLGYQMIDAGLPRMLVRMACERGERLTPLLRIRAAGAAQFMSMRPEYRRAFQSVTESEKTLKHRRRREAAAAAAEAAAAATSSSAAARSGAGAAAAAAGRASGEFVDGGTSSDAFPPRGGVGLGTSPAPTGTSEAVARAEWDRALLQQQLRAQAVQQQERMNQLLSPGKKKRKEEEEAEAQKKKKNKKKKKKNAVGGGFAESGGGGGGGGDSTRVPPTAQFSEILAVTLLYMSDYDLRCYGTTCIARQSVMHDSRKKAIVVLGGIDLLVSQLDQASNQSIFAEFATQALLNLSSYPPNQEYICVCCQGVALKRLLNMVRDPLRPTAASFAAAVLANVAHHPGNRTRLYKAELATGARDTFGPAQGTPIDQKDVASYQGVGGRLLTLKELSAGGESGTAAAGGGGGPDGGEGDPNSSGSGSADPANPKARRKMVRSRFDAWFAHEVEGDMTEAQLESIRKLEGDVVSAATSKRTHNAHRPRSPRLISEHVRQLHLRAAPVPHKMVAAAAKRNLQSSLCQPLSTLWHGKTPTTTSALGDSERLTLSKRAMASVKQLAMAASVHAGAHLSTTPGLTAAATTTDATTTIAKQDMLNSTRRQQRQRQGQRRQRANNDNNTNNNNTGSKNTTTTTTLPDFDPAWMDPASRSVLRWTPLVHKIERARPKASDSLTLDKVRSGRRAEMYATAPPDMTVFLEPRQSPRNQVQFKEGGILSSAGVGAGGGGGPSHGPSHGPRLAVWTHVDGSKASIGLFPEYRLPGGGKVFFYEHQGLHEAVFPPEAPPMPPMDEEAYGAPVPMRKLGAPCPDWQHDPPLLRSCPAPTPPPCPALAATMTTKAENADDKDGAVPSSLDAVLEHVAYGISPSFLIAHRAHVHVAETQLQLADAAAEQDGGFRLEDSIFAPRPFESDAAAFWDESWVEEAAFRVDWARAIRKQAYRNVLTGTHGYGHCAFEVKDEVEVKSRPVDGSQHHWYQARVRRIVRGPSLDVEYADGSREYYVSLARVRFPGGGKPGGYGGRCRRWRSPRKETKTMLLQSESLPDIVGLNGAEIRRIRLQSGCRISVERNGGDDAFAFKAEGVPENLEILEKILADIDHISLVRCALAHNYATALRAFNLFRASGSGNAFALTSNEYDSFLVKCKIVEPRSSSSGGGGGGEAAPHAKHARALEHSLRNIFKAVNFEEKALNEEQAKLNEFNLDSAVMRFEWLELLTRVAKCKYRAEASGLDEAVEMLFHRNIEPYLGSMGQVDHDIFRDAVLYRRPVAEVLARYRPVLIALFTGYAAKLHRGGVSKRRAVLMSQPEFLEMFRHLRLITHQFSVVEAKFAYFAAKMLVIDDVNQPHRATMITFVEFLEAMVRACDIHAIPTEAMIREAGFGSFDAYHDKVSTSGQTEDQASMRRQAIALHAKTASRHYLHRRHADPRPLHVRLEMFLGLVKKRLPRKGHVRAQRRIAAWYADGKYETTRNRAHDSLKYVRGTTVKALHDSVPAPTLVWVGKKEATGRGGGGGGKKMKKKKKHHHHHHQHHHHQHHHQHQHHSQQPQDQPRAEVTVLVAEEVPVEEMHLRREKKMGRPMTDEERILNAEVERSRAQQQPGEEEEAVARRREE
jgi:hypothetical protein